jgi:methyltransferase-like protein
MEQLADILNRLCNTIMRSKIQFESSAEKFKKYLKANLGDRRVVTAFRELISDESILYLSDYILNLHQKE